MADTMFLNIREAEPGDAHQIHELMLSAQTEMEDSSMYIVGSERKIERFLSTSGNYGYVATNDDEIVSFALFAMGRKSDEEKKGFPVSPTGEGLGRSLRCVSFATKPDFRLSGIATHLVTTGLSRGTRLGCQFAWTAIDPRNGNALKVMMRHGLSVQTTAGQLTKVDKRYVSYESDEAESDTTDRHAITRSILYGPLHR